MYHVYCSSCIKHFQCKIFNVNLNSPILFHSEFVLFFWLPYLLLFVSWQAHLEAVQEMYELSQTGIFRREGATAKVCAPDAPRHQRQLTLPLGDWKDSFNLWVPFSFSQTTALSVGKNGNSLEQHNKMYTCMFWAL